MKTKYQLFAKAIAGLEDAETPAETKPGLCCLSGIECECVDMKDVLGKSFTNYDLLKAPQSKMISADAYTSLTFKWERMSCWIVSNGVFKRLDMKIDKELVRNIVYNGCESPSWMSYITTRYKKHGLLHCVVNKSGRGIIRFEGQNADCRNGELVNSLNNSMQEMIRLGFGRTVLETLDCPSYILREKDINQWLDFVSFAQKHRDSGLYQLLCYLLPTQEELKAERKDIGIEEPEKKKEEKQVVEKPAKKMNPQQLSMF